MIRLARHTAHEDARPSFRTRFALSKSSDAFRLTWHTVTPQTAPALSGIAVLFGQARAKINLARVLGKPAFSDVRHPYEPGLLFDRAVAPLVAWPITGVLWYQGESNASTCGTPDVALGADAMLAGLTSLVTGWRRAWSRDDLPFVLIQLPRMNRPWMIYREQQMRVAQTLPNVGLVVTTDTGNPANVHPADKQPVAERAAVSTAPSPDCSTTLIFIHLL